MTRLRAVLALSAVLLLSISACSSPTPTDAPEAVTDVATPTPTIQVLSIEEAANAYLDAVCPSNAANNQYKAAGVVLTDAGPDGDIAPLKAAAVTLRDAEQASAVALLDPAVVWPEVVRADVATIGNSYFADIAGLNGIAAATSIDQMNAVTFNAASDEVKAAAPRVRTNLGLALDTDASCAGR